MIPPDTPATLFIAICLVTTCTLWLTYEFIKLTLKTIKKMEIVKGILMCIGALCVAGAALLGVVVAGVMSEHSERREPENWEDME